MVLAINLNEYYKEKAIVTYGERSFNLLIVKLAMFERNDTRAAELRHNESPFAVYENVVEQPEHSFVVTIRGLANLD